MFNNRPKPKAVQVLSKYWENTYNLVINYLQLINGQLYMISEDQYEKVTHVWGASYQVS